MTISATQGHACVPVTSLQCAESYRVIYPLTGAALTHSSSSLVDTAIARIEEVGFLFFAVNMEQKEKLFTVQFDFNTPNWRTYFVDDALIVQVIEVAKTRGLSLIRSRSYESTTYTRGHSGQTTVHIGDTLRPSSAEINPM